MAGSLESLRELNRLRVVDALRVHGTLSRADIARKTGLSRSTVSTLAGDLLDRGFVTARPESNGRQLSQGRPPVLLRLDPSAGTVVGVDFDHQYVRVAVSDLARTVLAEGRIDADVDNDATGALDAAGELVRTAVAQAGTDMDRVIGVGVALASPIDQAAGRVQDSQILPNWHAVEASKELTARLGVPVHMDNDANLGALAEVTLGAGSGVSTALYVQMSSGIGAGLVLDGQPFRGAAGLAGELGHVAVDDRGALCRCGNRGCLETVASARAIAELLGHSLGATMRTPDIVELANDGHPGARRALADAGAAVGRVVGNVCNILNPEMVVIGGDLSATGELLVGPLREAVMRSALPAATRGLTVVAGELGERANVLGALALAIAQSGHAVAARIAAEGAGDMTGHIVSNQEREA